MARIHDLVVPLTRRPRFLREMRHSTSVILLFLGLILYLAYLGRNYILNLDFFPGPTSEGRENMRYHPGTNENTATMNSFANILDGMQTPNLPKLALVPGTNIIQVLDDDADTSHPLSSPLFVTEDSATHVDNLLYHQYISRARHDTEHTGPFHYVHPLHAASNERISQAFKIVPKLQDCAAAIIRKVQEQSTDNGPELQTVLHDCKSTIDLTLEFMPSYQRRGPGAQSVSTKCSAAVYGVVPGQLETITSSHSMQSKHSRNLFRRSNCNENVCDWVNPNSLDRCYHRDEIEYLKSGTVRYTNDSVDDFKDTAPLECNLCLPTINQTEIDMHCKRVERIEKDVLHKVLIAGGTFSVLAIMGVTWKIRWRRRQGRTGKQLPAVMRGGHLDKRLIGRPMLISRAADHLEGAFEIPRAAPAPPML